MVPEHSRTIRRPRWRAARPRRCAWCPACRRRWRRWPPPPGRRRAGARSPRRSSRGRGIQASTGDTSTAHRANLQENREGEKTPIWHVRLVPLKAKRTRFSARTLCVHKCGEAVRDAGVRAPTRLRSCGGTARGGRRHEADGEARALARLALDVDGAAHQLDQVLHDGEAQAGAAELAGAAGVDAVEALEDARRGARARCPTPSSATAISHAIAARGARSPSRARPRRRT